VTNQKDVAMRRINAMDITPEMKQRMIKDLKVESMGQRKTGSSPNKKTYKQAYAGLSESQKKKYKSEADFINQAKSYNIKKYGTTEPTKKSKQSGVSKTEMEKLAKPKKVVRKTGESTVKPKKAKVTPSRKPSKADQITTAKREGGRSTRKIAAAERKLAKAAGDTSKRGDRKRRKADKKMKKAGIA
jgi:hypothetical protein